MDNQFKWDHNKNKQNQQKHGVEFAEAATVFADPALVTLFDTRSSVEEERYSSIRFSHRGRLLVVIYTICGAKTRIISSRPCTPREAEYYANQ